MTALRGKCIDTTNTLNLDSDTIYYLFEHTPESYFVSRFNMPGAHFGAYQKSRFEIVEVGETEEENILEAVGTIFTEEATIKEKSEEQHSKSEDSLVQLSFFDLLD